MAEMLEKMPADIPVMGNVDPAGVLRQGTPETVREATISVMERCCSHKNFVISSGCDIPPATPWENIDAFFAAVEEYYEK
jgi:uroporphyrinogen decarboxylase